MSRARWWRSVIGSLLAVSVLMTGSAAAAMAAYPASIDVNTTAFNPPCDPDANAIVPKMMSAAKAAYAGRGYVASTFTGAAFTRAATLARTANDWGYYVHRPDGPNYSKCVAQAHRARITGLASSSG